ncbi:MBL fold metallo-hydrolase [Clostridium sp. CM028]|uniref:MBL fold metallo-hydrolase n=1 Tax=Clostridium sp. CM028 TaxID=2851575 RepID=UPI001C6DEAC6|nr:MBL fold metallo-hydrolase [Clostridium sp. CM028]MBW9147679.1 MBL fold metallo-hydrolase [Clostridium sp. CM028]WLC62006.1 MBL fold metallo-hydrolase [Clostridium sp. CM028]
MKLTALIENKATGNLSGEHGLAVHIEYNGKQYLLDTGASNKFQNNANKLGIDLKNIDTAALSHCHYDHSGGYVGFFSENSKAKVYLQSAARELYYAKLGLIKIYNGIPRGILDTYSDRFVFVDGDYEIDEGVWLISHKTIGLAARGKKAHMYRKTEKGFVADDFQHEQSLVFEVENGLVILNSCCHGGVDNIIEEVMETFNGKEVLAIIGGFHLMGIIGTKSMSGKPEEVRALGKRLFDLNVKHIYTGHCTGNPAYKVLKEKLGERLQYFSTGTTVEL